MLEQQRVSFWDSNSHQNDKCLISYDFPESGVFSFSYREKSWPENYYLFWSINQNGTQHGWFGSLDTIELSFNKNGDQNWQIIYLGYLQVPQVSKPINVTIETHLNNAFSFIGSLLRSNAKEFLQ